MKNITKREKERHIFEEVHKVGLQGNIYRVWNTITNYNMKAY